jgi:hypothetical protein
MTRKSLTLKLRQENPWVVPSILPISPFYSYSGRILLKGDNITMLLNAYVKRCFLHLVFLEFDIFRFYLFQPCSLINQLCFRNLDGHVLFSSLFAALASNKLNFILRNVHLNQAFFSMCLSDCLGIDICCNYHL